VSRGRGNDAPCRGLATPELDVHIFSISTSHHSVELGFDGVPDVWRYFLQAFEGRATAHAPLPGWWPRLSAAAALGAAAHVSRNIAQRNPCERNSPALPGAPANVAEFNWTRGRVQRAGAFRQLEAGPRRLGVGQDVEWTIIRLHKCDTNAGPGQPHPPNKVSA
jgi:hypothetical protein